MTSNTIVTMLLCASEMYVKFNIPSFDELLQKKIFFSFRSKIQDSGNLLVNSIVKSSVQLFSKLWTWWSVRMNFLFRAILECGF